MNKFRLPEVRFPNLAQMLTTSLDAGLLPKLQPGEKAAIKKGVLTRFESIAVIRAYLTFSAKLGNFEALEINDLYAAVVEILSPANPFPDPIVASGVEQLVEAGFALTFEFNGRQFFLPRLKILELADLSGFLPLREVASV